ncbi:hypothetical protein [Parasediminibacterium sp. JCM 36343]|uniref:hypothetical protein n=1 Tax=Parasediminibacterium sp. JCM 36343 TaxID=3374279 RepID=UPI00397C245A
MAKKKSKRLLFTSIVMVPLFFTHCSHKVYDAAKSDAIDLDSFKRVLPLVFNSGFELGTELYTHTPQMDWIKGVVHTVQPPNDWEPDIHNKNGLGEFRIYYEGGTRALREAKIVKDPLDATNNVLMFHIAKPNVFLPSGEIKGRVQADLYSNKDLKEFFQSERLLLPNDFNKLVAGTRPGEGDWLTLDEIWNDEQWTGKSKYPFRISMGLKKKDMGIEGSKLVFRVEAQTYSYETHKFSKYWEHEADDFDLPIGKWMTLDIYFKEGNINNGRFYLAATVDGKKNVLFNITDYTHHPNNPNPDGVSEYNPLKFYTSGKLVDYMNEQGGEMKIYWDDFKFWKK